MVYAIAVLDPFDLIHIEQTEEAWATSDTTAPNDLKMLDGTQVGRGIEIQPNEAGHYKYLHLEMEDRHWKATLKDGVYPVKVVKGKIYALSMKGRLKPLKLRLVQAEQNNMKDGSMILLPSGKSIPVDRIEAELPVD